MSNNLIKRILTSILLLFLLIFVNFSFLFKILLFIISFLLFLEFRNIFKKIFNKHSGKNKKNIKYFIFNSLAFIYLFVIFPITSIELHDNIGSSLLFLFIISICILSDIGGYVVGKTIGGKKLTKISPNKTISGTIGSFIFSLFTLIIFENLFNYSIDLNLNTIIFIMMVSLASQFGDLFISYLKRMAKIKDTGSLLPGHGGILDRLDGIIFAIPFSYLLIKFF
jgi:phosphatidate cytidylyltransferase